MKKEYNITEYIIDEYNMIFIFPSLSFDSWKEIMEYVSSRWDDEKTYMTHEGCSNESFIKSTTNYHKFFHVVEEKHFLDFFPCCRRKIHFLDFFPCCRRKKI